MYTYHCYRMTEIRKIMPKYYTYDGQKYSICFPLEWAINHFEKTGPTECKNCWTYGCDDSVFKQYCDDCHIYEYMGTRITNEYCKAALLQPRHLSEKNESLCFSRIVSDVDDISDISDDDDYWANDHRPDIMYDGIDECKLSIISRIDNLTDRYSDTDSNQYDETHDTSAVMPIFNSLLTELDKETNDDYYLHIEKTVPDLLHEAPLRVYSMSI